MTSMNLNFDTSKDILAIKDLLAAQREGWNRGSGSEFAAVFSSDADFIAFDGTLLKGKQAIASFHQRSFDAHLKNTKLESIENQIRFLSPDVAVIHTVGGAISPGKLTTPATGQSIQTTIAKKTEGRWEFTAFQNTRLRPLGKSWKSILSWILFDLIWKCLGSR